ncbi:MAG: hypothetical protein ABIH23_06115 [bacterium]
MDLGTGLAIIGTGNLAKDLIMKLLGPTADYLGGEMKGYAEKGLHNLNNIFSRAIKRLGTKIDEPGRVPPKVLKSVLTDGYFCEDPLTAEYFAGVLAASRSEIERDDRGTTFAQLIGRLSTYQIRTHYILYSLSKCVDWPLPFTPLSSQKGHEPRMYMSLNAYSAALGLAQDENPLNTVAHSLHGLAREDLVFHIVYGEKEDLGLIQVESDGLVAGLSPLGVQFFCWAHGRSDIWDINDFLSPDTIFEILPEVEIPTQGFLGMH